MKAYHYLVTIISIVAITAGCAGSKEARTMKKSIDGKWNLETVIVDGNNAILNVKVFNEADNSCFIGSNWNFIGNNGTGEYRLLKNEGGCSNVTRKIRWTIYEPAGEEKRFQFKRLDDKNNPMDDGNGYRLTINDLTDSTMKFTSQITYNNKPVNIIYNFVKKQS